eukprot:TRINITY_DN9250_c0_g1_i2.p1 TRINITY_DN9250_c0_g1~~TRINITY_DN9250_c0_g1_i2.p1  ORF type:complete len:210 (-),score=12.20 TRINITY_DN9250_c0_g1_i2:175-804(-)
MANLPVDQDSEEEIEEINLLSVYEDGYLAHYEDLIVEYRIDRPLKIIIHDLQTEDSRERDLAPYLEKKIVATLKKDSPLLVNRNRIDHTLLYRADSPGTYIIFSVTYPGLNAHQNAIAYRIYFKEQGIPKNLFVLQGPGYVKRVLLEFEDDRAELKSYLIEEGGRAIMKLADTDHESFQAAAMRDIFLEDTMIGSNSRNHLYFSRYLPQ